MNFRQLAYGIASFLPIPPDWLTPGTGGTNSAEYCYAVWLRHLVLSRNHGMRGMPATLAELGPGDSIGVGMAAVISGVSNYYAFDAVPHADVDGSVRLFDDLVEMFRRRDPIPGPDAFPGMEPQLPGYEFPSEILADEHLADALAPGRLELLRADLMAGGGNTFFYRAPWDQPAEGEEGKIDFVISNAVMEHVTDIDSTYISMEKWLKRGAFSSNQIDFRSHGLFQGWDGHWACPEWLWFLMKGRRAYLLNRLPYSAHARAVKMSGMDIVVANLSHQPPERQKLAFPFGSLEPSDRSTSGAYMLLRKNP